jgi:hypothetical protein
MAFYVWGNCWYLLDRRKSGPQATLDVVARREMPACTRYQNPVIRPVDNYFIACAIPHTLLKYFLKQKSREHKM